MTKLTQLSNLLANSPLYGGAFLAFVMLSWTGFAPSCALEPAACESCVLKLGSLCTDPAECASESCVDGVCCDRSCGICEACNVMESIGICTATAGRSEDCSDGASCSLDGDCRRAVSFAQVVGASLADTVEHVSNNGQGSYALSGRLFGPPVFGDQSKEGAIDGAFVALVKSGGLLRYARGFTGEVEVNAIHLLDSGELLVGGSFVGEVDFDDGPRLATGRDGFLLALSRNGVVLWVEHIGGLEDQQVTAIAGGDELVTFAGNYATSLQLGDTDLVGAGLKSAFIARRSVDGATLFAQNVSSTGQDRVAAITVDEKGRTFATGSHSGPLALGAITLPHMIAEDAFVLALSASGEPLWAHSAGGIGSDAGRDLALDHKRRELTMAGFFTKTIDLGGGTLRSAGCEDLFLARFDMDGNHQWSRRWGGDQAEFPTSLVQLDDGGLVLAGFFAGSLDFGWGPLPSAGGLDGFLVEVEATGDPRWARRYGDADDDTIACLARRQPTSGLLMVGTVVGDIDFGDGPLQAAGPRDGFVVGLR